MSYAHGQIAGRYSEVRGGAMRPRVSTLAAVLIALLIAVAVALPLPNLGGASIAITAIHRAKSFVELMHQRSPGKRLVGHLAQTKHKKLAVHERALPKIRRRAPQRVAMIAFPSALPPALVEAFGPALPMQMASLEAVPVGPFSEQPLWPFPPSTPSGGFILPPTEIPTPTPPVGPIAPPKAALPEPGSWAMMLLGFAVLGWGLRSREDREQIAP